MLHLYSRVKVYAISNTKKNYILIEETIIKIFSYNMRVQRNRSNNHVNITLTLHTRRNLSYTPTVPLSNAYANRPDDKLFNEQIDEVSDISLTIISSLNSLIS